MVDYFTNIATQLGISIWLLALIMLWDGVWKLLALWKSARRGSVIWFIVLAIVNSIGILPILYIFVFSELGFGKRKKKKDKKKSYLE